jgi:hypothetical protein
MTVTTYVDANILFFAEKDKKQGFSVVGFRLLVFGCGFSIVGFRLLVVGCGLCVIGFRLLVVGCWLSFFCRDGLGMGCSCVEWLRIGRELCWYGAEWC